MTTDLLTQRRATQSFPLFLWSKPGHSQMQITHADPGNTFGPPRWNGVSWKGTGWRRDSGEPTTLGSSGR
jgi:hypothetical protein